MSTTSLDDLLQASGLPKLVRCCTCAHAPKDHGRNGCAVDRCECSAYTESVPVDSVAASLRTLGRLADDADLDRVDREALRARVVEVAGRFGLRASAVNALLGEEPKAGDEDGRSGSVVVLNDPEPWPGPVDGSELLDDLEGTLLRFLGLPEFAPVVLALWVVHAHAHDAAEVSPLLALTSPEKRCGKTTALHVLGKVVPRPLPASNVTAAALFRAVEQFRPTLLVDEADTFLRGREELRGVLNSGHARASAVVVRTVGDDHEARAFATWSPKAVAMIGKLPDTLADRSLVIPMRRRRPGEKVERLRLDRLAELEHLPRRAWRWARDHLDALRASDPEVPPELHDRAADNWRPLLAIADLAGGEWPTRARAAARAMAGAGGGEDGSVGTLLLRDIRDLFSTRRTDRLPSMEIATALAEMEGRPWPEWGRSRKPITQNAIARLLSPYEVGPKTINFPDKGSLRGYMNDEKLQDTFDRYLPAEERPEPQPPQPSKDGAGPRGSANRNPGASVALGESVEAPHETSKVAGVAVVEGGAEQEDDYEAVERAAIQAKADL